MAVVNRNKTSTPRNGRPRRPVQNNQNLIKESDCYEVPFETEEELEEQFQDEDEDWDDEEDDSFCDDEEDDLFEAESDEEDELEQEDQRGEETSECEPDEQSFVGDAYSNQQIQTNATVRDEISDIEFVPTNFTSSNAKSRVPAMLSIINTKKSGRRISINVEKVLEPLGIQDKVQVSYNQMEKAIILGNNLGGTSYPLRKLQKKAVLYNSNLIQKLTEALELNFEQQSTISFSKVKLVAHKQAGQIAIITQ